MAEKIYKSLESLEPIKKVINEAAEALNDPERTIASSAIPGILGAALGAGIGYAGSFAALSTLGVAGLSAAGITSGLATAGAVVGGGMVAGIGVLAAPAVILGVLGYWLLSPSEEELKLEKEKLYKTALKRHDAIIRKMKKDVNASEEREDYLRSLNVVLRSIIKDLKSDLAQK
ncbi:hypothetical protein FACS1894189_9270 [Planctomycetales bacterium]|nr:hypothetical protein FACS1894189_9270 [Planctomycetales bacterium]